MISSVLHSGYEVCGTLVAQRWSHKQWITDGFDNAVACNNKPNRVKRLQCSNYNMAANHTKSHWRAKVLTRYKVYVGSNSKPQIWFLSIKLCWISLQSENPRVELNRLVVRDKLSVIRPKEKELILISHNKYTKESIRELRVWKTSKELINLLSLC